MGRAGNLAGSLLSDCPAGIQLVYIEPYLTSLSSTCLAPYKLRLVWERGALRTSGCRCPFGANRWISLVAE